MPDISAAPTIEATAYSVKSRNFTGKPNSVSIGGGAEATEAQFTALRTAMGDASNARVMQTKFSNTVRQLNPANPLNTTYDEAFATVDIRAVLLFQDDTGAVEYLRVPAPDASLFLPDGETLVVPTPGSLLQAIITAALAVLNATTPIGTYVYVRGYREGTASASRIPLPIEEPGLTDNPPDAPGV